MKKIGAESWWRTCRLILRGRLSFTLMQGSHSFDAFGRRQDLKDFGRAAGRVLHADVYSDKGEKYGVIEYATKEWNISI